MRTCGKVAAHVRLRVRCRRRRCRRCRRCRCRRSRGRPRRDRQRPASALRESHHTSFHHRRLRRGHLLQRRPPTESTPRWEPPAGLPSVALGRVGGISKFTSKPHPPTMQFLGPPFFFVIFLLLCVCVCVRVCVCVWCNTKQQTTTGTKTNEGSSLLQHDLKIRGACSDCLALGLGPARPHAPATWQQRVLIADRRAATV